MKRLVWVTLGIILVSFCSSFAVSATRDLVSELRSRGYALIPAPQQLSLKTGDISVDRSWRILNLVGGDDQVASHRLEEGARSLHGLVFDGSGDGEIVLRIDPQAISQVSDAELREQAYRLSCSPGRIEIVGCGRPGLFYGVQSLLQLLQERPGGGYWVVPAGEIVDWPTLQLRFIHWDTKHHQDRLDTLERFIEWAAFFKVNAIGFEIEDKFEYPSHPVIGAPGAFTSADLKHLTEYALKRYIQLVPQIQAPAHMAYVLKHAEFAHLRADGSNYQACLCDEEAISLIQDMYQDMIDATPGVRYFHVSTDEVYYAGICEKCRANQPYNDRNRSLAWVDFVNRMYRWLDERDRQMLCWVEYPLLAEHIDLLPRGLINGVMVPGRSDEWIQSLRAQSIPSLVYSSMQGSELLFPNLLSSEYLYRGRPVRGRVEDPARSVQELLNRGAEILGTYAAAWDDSGLHCETFWLGWATVTQYGWTPSWPRIEQSVADFMDVFYGPGNLDMVNVYQDLIAGARFFESSLDRIPATRLKPTYGSWAGKGRDTTRIDLTLTPPSLPFSYDETLIAERRFSRQYGPALKQAPAVRRKVTDAIQALQGKLSQVRRNRYNIEVLLSIAYFEKHFVDMLLQLQQVEALLLKAADALAEERQETTIAMLLQAYRTVDGILKDRAEMWRGVVRVFEKSRFPKGRSVGGKTFVHVLDDLKDHRADRRAGLDYMLEPLENIGLEEWNDRLAGFIQSFAASRGLTAQIKKRAR